MRPLVCLALLLPALTAPPAAFGSESDLESLQRKLAREVQQRIDAGMRTALDASVSAHAPARPTRMTCRASAEYVLECVVVAKRPGLARIARSR